MEKVEKRREIWNFMSWLLQSRFVSLPETWQQQAAREASAEGCEDDTTTAKWMNGKGSVESWK